MIHAILKDPMLRKVYDLCRKRGPTLGSAPLSNAYRNGFAGVRNTWVRGSMQHAAWLAGRDARKEQNR
jgi:hypothetical protein